MIKKRLAFGVLFLALFILSMSSVSAATNNPPYTHNSGLCVQTGYECPTCDPAWNKTCDTIGLDCINGQTGPGYCQPEWVNNCKSSENCGCSYGNGTILYYQDSDGDTYGDSSNSRYYCEDENPLGWILDNTDCDDNNVNAWFLSNPGSPAYVDSDGDGYGAGAKQIGICIGSSWAPSGYALNNGDCDDNNAPTCNTDCSTKAYYASDVDSYCDSPLNSHRECDAPAGYTFSNPALCTDCANTNSSAWQIDTFCYDEDGDGYTTGTDSLNLCYGSPSPPSQTQFDCSTFDDCAPSDPTRWVTTVAYPDRDNDGYGDNPSEVICIGSGGLNYNGINYTYTPGDCDDSTSLCNVGSNACDWLVYYDGDQDTYCDPNTDPIRRCDASTVDPDYNVDFNSNQTGMCTGNYSDCDDTNPNRYWLGDFYLDADRDYFCLNQEYSGNPFCYGVEINTWPTSPDYTYGPSCNDFSDCNDADNTKWREMDFCYDSDLDTYTTGNLTNVCYGTVEPPNQWQYSCSVFDDCAPNDPTRWTNQTFYYKDCDGDGFGNTSTGKYYCVGGPSTLVVDSCNLVLSAGDCDDSVPSCNVDCATQLYNDSDTDGYCNPNLDSHRKCDAAFPYIINDSNLCTDCAPNNISAWHTDTFCYDEDEDGYTTGTDSLTLCYGTPSPPRQTQFNCSVFPDCSPSDPNRWQDIWAYRDDDQDGYGNTSTGAYYCFGADMCIPQPDPDAGCYNLTSGDCDDGVFNCNVGAQSCDWLNFYDGDQDNFCDSSVPGVRRCDAPYPYTVDLNTNDSTACTNPFSDCDDGVPECNNNYNGNYFACDWLNYYDGDNDTYCNSSIAPIRRCDAYIVNPLYSVDFNTTQTGQCVNPRSDCDDQVASCNVDCVTPFYADTDSDNYGDPSNKHRYCDASAVYINDSRDCDDTIASLWNDANWVLASSNGTTLARVDSNGIMGITGNVTIGSVPDLPNSFKIRNSAGTLVAIIDGSTGDLYVNALNENYAPPGTGGFSIQNQGTPLASFTSAGNLDLWCLIRKFN